MLLQKKGNLSNEQASNAIAVADAVFKIFQKKIQEFWIFHLK